VEGAATAANWKNWGTLEIRKGSLYDQGAQKTLAGAVVVLHPSKDTGTTGHVCFAINRLETSDKIKCVGGNQKDTVRTDSLDISRIASIRLLVPIVSPTGDDQLILARTIFGEAAGEPVEGIEAVAEVVVNRSASGRYPKSVSSVCLQPYQFSCWNATDPNRTKILSLSPGNGNRAFDVCFDVAGRALSGTIHHFTDGVLHYHADYISKPSWVIDSPHALMERKIGHHLFYSGIS
jgi:spore germination cell wall hydrolase CwlJ-like protein